MWWTMLILWRTAKKMNVWETLWLPLEYDSSQFKEANSIKRLSFIAVTFVLNLFLRP